MQFTRGAPGRRGGRPAPPRQTRQPAITSSSSASVDAALVQADAEQLGEIAGIQAARVVGHRGRGIAVADDRDVLAHDGLARLRSARSCRRPRLRGRRSRSPAASRRPCRRAISCGAGRPGTSAVVTTTSLRGDVLGEQLALEALRVLRELLGVAAARLAGLGQLDLEEAWRRGSRPARARPGARRTR